MQGLAYATTHNPAPMNPHQRPEHLHLSDINVGYPHNNLNYASSHPHTNNARFVSDCDEWYSQSVNTYAQMPRVAHGPTQSTFVSHTNQFANVNQAISQAPPHGYYNPHHHHDRLHHSNVKPTSHQYIPSVAQRNYSTHLSQSNYPSNKISRPMPSDQFTNTNETPMNSTNFDTESTNTCEQKEGTPMGTGNTLNLHFSASSDGGELLPSMILHRKDCFPQFLKMKCCSDRHYLYACHWQHKLSTAQNDADFAGSEKAIMTRFNLTNGFTLMQKIKYKRVFKKSETLRKIHVGKCSGGNRTPSTCDIVPLWIRIEGNLVLYFSAGINTKAILDLRHLPGCIQTKSKVPFVVLQYAARSSYSKNKARRMLQEFRTDMDSVMSQTLKNAGIDITYASGAKRFSKAVSNRIQTEKKKQRGVTPDSRKPFAFKDILKLIKECSMAIAEFCAKDDSFIRENLGMIVILAHDVGTEDDMRCSGFVFTTIGRLYIFRKVIEMYNWKRKHLDDNSTITMQIDGLVIFGPDTLKAVHLAFSDFLHQTFVALFAVSREEDKPISTMITKVAMDIIRYFGGPQIPHMLMDGGRALHATAVELCLPVKNCKHHMSDRTSGKGTAGYNQCGSFGRYLNNMALTHKKPKKFFEWTNSNFFFMFEAKEPQRIATLLLYKYILGVWLPMESKGKIKAMVAPTATLDDVERFLRNEFNKHAGMVESVNGQKKVGKHKCIKIIIWFVHYYFKILGEFTHGSVHNPGDPMNTNGLEGTNYPFQKHSKELYDSQGCNKIEAYMMCVQQKTLMPDNFHVSPSSTGVEWRKVFKYCRKRKNGNEPIPKLFQYMFGYKGNGDYEHIPWEELVTELTSVGKDTTGDKKLILYLPTVQSLTTIKLLMKSGNH